MKDNNMYLRKKKAENLNNILVCENCGEQQISVCDSRMLAGTRRRRRTCNVCGHKSTTYEISNEEFERLLNEGENQKAKYNHGYTKGYSDGYAKAIDRIVEQLEEAKTNFEGMGTLQSAYYDKGIDKAIEIVKAGGKDE